MNEREYLAERFEEHRAHLRAVAYRMLGSVNEVDDAVQEAWLRLNRANRAEIDNLGGWLTTVVARVCLDLLRSRQSRREEPIDLDTPEAIASRAPGGSPEQETLLADSVGLALLIVLDKLTPSERLAFVLHDMFGIPFDEIAPIVGRSADATRQLASRARRRVRGGGAPDRGLVQQRAIVEASSRRCARATSRACWRCSIPISSFVRICRARRPTSVARRSGRRGRLRTATWQS